MTTTTKNILALVIGAVIAGGVYGGYKFLFSASPQQTAGTSPQGATFTSAKFAGVAVNLAAPGANATSSSILNTDQNDRYVTAIKAGCEGVGSSNTAYSGAGLAALTLKTATSSTAAPLTNTNTNLVGGSSLTLPTSTAFTNVASSTSGVGTNNAAFQVWASGSYLTFTTNATNTAQCTFGADYFGS